MTAAWQQALAAERAAYARYDAIDEGVDPDGYASAEAEWSALEDALMAMPAPDNAALLHKLNRLFPPDEAGRATASWSWGYAGQTLHDMRRLLGEAH